MNQTLQKLRKEAQTKAARGDLGGALAAYQAALKESPNDPRLWVNIGDICLKLNQKKEALQIYGKAADQYSAQGDLKQASSVLQAILNIHPKHAAAAKQLRILQSRQALAKAGDRGGDTIAQWQEQKNQGNKNLHVGSTESMVHDDSAISFGDDNTDSNLLEFADQARQQPDLDADTLELTGMVHSNIMQQPVEKILPADRVKKIVAAMPDVPLFAGLTPDQIAEAAAHITLHTFDPGDVVIQEGEQADGVYVIASGSVSVTKKDPNGQPVGLNVLPEGNFFGESSYLTGQPSFFSVAAFDECRILEIHRPGIEQLTEIQPKIQKILENYYRRRLIDATIAVSPVFRLLPDTARDHLIDLFEAGRIPVGTILCEQGSDANAVYLVVSGTVTVTVQTPDGIKSPEELGPGQSFGEVSIFKNQPSPASYTTGADSRILKLSPDHFRALLEKHNILQQSVDSMVEARIRKYQSA